MVELLVVIGIIAILAGVALGPITSGIKKAQQSSGVQTSRTIALSEFTYSNDNNQTWPLSSSGSASTAADPVKVLLAGNYISDPSIFYIGGSKETKYTGTTASTSITQQNISFDFWAQSSTQAYNANVPDQAPVITSSFGTGVQVTPSIGASGYSAPVQASNPYGTAGIAVCYKSNSAKFVQAATSGNVAPIIDPTIPSGTSLITLPGGG